MTTRRPRIGLIGEWAAIEVLDDDGNVRGYTDRCGGFAGWSATADFTPLAEVPGPRMDEPQETWATVVTKETLDWTSRVYYRRPDGWWERLDSRGRPTAGRYPWSDLIDPRPTTPTERATGIVGGEQS